jgi:hypothetical protein
MTDKEKREHQKRTEEFVREVLTEDFGQKKVSKGTVQTVARKVARAVA